MSPGNSRLKPVCGAGPESYARLFFALWPQPAVASSLYQAGKRLHRLCGGRCTRPESLHLTLAFLGSTPRSRLESLQAAAGQVKAPAFALQLGDYGWFPRARVAWTTAENAPAALHDLANRLRANLKVAGFPFDAKPFFPHVTLLRRAHCGSLSLEATQPVAWSVREFVLVESALGPEGSQYSMLGRWSLDAA